MRPVGEWAGEWGREARQAARSLGRSRTFTLVAAATLALGIGANTAVFSLVRAVVLAPPPYAEPERLAAVWERNLTQKHTVSVPYPDYDDWRRTPGPFEALGAVQWWDYGVTAPGAPEHVAGKKVSAGFFRMLGVGLQAGREIEAEDDRPGGAAIAVIGDGLAERKFGGARAALGRAIELDGVDYTVAGVLPAGFTLMGEAAEVYTPIGQSDERYRKDRTVHPGILCIGRLRRGVSLEAASARMAAEEAELARLYPEADRGLTAEVVPLKEAFWGGTGRTVLLVWAAVGMVLLIACANVASLTMTRAAGRAQEFAVRRALGAGRARMARMLAAESLMVALGGGAMGLGVAEAGLKAMRAVAGASVPMAKQAGLSGGVLAFAFAVSACAGLAFGLWPAMSGEGAEGDWLRTGSRSARSGVRAQKAMVAAQMALTVVLLAGAGLLLRTIQKLWEQNPGFDARGLMTFQVGLSPAVGANGAAMRRAMLGVVERVREVPGVEAAELVSPAPMSGNDNTGPFWFGPSAPASMSEAARALYYWTGPEYLKTMGIRLLRGRYFTGAETEASEKVVAIDSTLERAYFGHGSAIGQAIHVAHWGRARIIGVVAHVRHFGLGGRRAGNPYQIYAPFSELAGDWVPLFQADLTVVARTRLRPAEARAAMERAALAADGGEPLHGVRTMEEMIGATMAPQRFPMMLLLWFAGLALALASVGIYGVMSNQVARRGREIGIRMALGAGRGRVVGMVVGQGMGMAAAGMAAGGAAAVALGRAAPAFSGLLYGVSVVDPATLAGAVGVLGVAALAACWAPARRAARVDPGVALRGE